MRVPILLLAAGASRRMRGTDKLLEQVAGMPLLRRQASAALSTGAQVFVALPEAAAPRLQALQGLPVRLVTVRDAAEGMAASLRAGISAIEDTADGVLVLLADLPDITADDLRAVLAAFQTDPAAILRATAQDGTPGHPVVFPKALFCDLSKLTGDEGARSVLARHLDRTRFIALPGTHATTDLDTPEAWAAWRAGRTTDV